MWWETASHVYQCVNLIINLHWIASQPEVVSDWMALTPCCASYPVVTQPEKCSYAFSCSPSPCSAWSSWGLPLLLEWYMSLMVRLHVRLSLNHYQQTNEQCSGCHKISCKRRRKTAQSDTVSGRSANQWSLVSRLTNWYMCASVCALHIDSQRATEWTCLPWRLQNLWTLFRENSTFTPYHIKHTTAHWIFQLLRTHKVKGMNIWLIDCWVMYTLLLVIHDYQCTR
jgi:hypothetical protein